MLVQTPDVDYAYISTATTTLLKAGPGKLYRLCITSTQTFTAVVYDGNPDTGKIIASFSIAAADKQVGTFDLGCSFFQSLTIVTTGTPPITVIFD